LTGRVYPGVLFTSVGVAALALLAGAQCHARSFSGSITGVIIDTSGAVVPDIAVTVIQLETNRKVAATSRGDGGYVAIALPVGDYRIEAAAPGFKLAVRDGIKLEMNQAAVINIALEVGTSIERVEVKGDVALLDADNGLDARQSAESWEHSYEKTEARPGPRRPHP